MSNSKKEKLGKVLFYFSVNCNNIAMSAYENVEFGLRIAGFDTKLRSKSRGKSYSGRSG